MENEEIPSQTSDNTTNTLISQPSKDVLFKYTNMLLSIDVGIRNLGMCLMDGKTIRNWDASGIPPLQDGGIFQSLLKHLRDREWVLQSQHVLIEKQPDKNKTMKSVEHFLHTYFLVHGKTVIVYDARHKIPDVVGPGRAMYIKRKKASVDRCTEFLKEHNPDRLEWFLAQKKKDDLADTVMQALSYTPPQTETAKKKKVTPRKPTPRQTDSRYSKSNLAWIHLHGEKDRRFYKDLSLYYTGLDQLILDL